ncbi:hypothetical protein [Streptomyces sp. NPDC047968]|uniref:hypothetical protein n=1 Tax=unclassified Streptomyces TaxID=2593676 RepID=UPI003436990D
MSIPHRAQTAEPAPSAASISAAMTALGVYAQPPTDAELTVTSLEGGGSERIVEELARARTALAEVQAALDTLPATAAAMFPDGVPGL